MNSLKLKPDQKFVSFYFQYKFNSKNDWLLERTTSGSDVFSSFSCLQIKLSCLSGRYALAKHKIWSLVQELLDEMLWPVIYNTDKVIKTSLLALNL